jgi:uncharacterized SAM-binding protein YcdF (DUF218 family)
MRATVTEIFHVLLSFPLWVFLALVALTVHAWRARASRLHRWRRTLAFAAAAFYLVTMPVLPATLETWLEQRHPVPRILESDRRPDNVIVVLTAGWLRRTPTGYEQKLGEGGWERTAAAVRLWRRIGGRLLFSGAPTPDGPDSAAAAMARLAGEMGVPPQALLVEPSSLNTRENLLFSKRLLGSGHGRVWLVTSALHMPRSVMAAEGLGLAVTPYPCDFRADESVRSWTQFVPNNSARPALERALHEIAGMAVYRLRGWG